jgi:hypothetical protein
MRIPLAVLVAIPLSALADGGTLVARRDTPAGTVSVFAAPAPLRAGPVDFSVLLQDRESTVVLDAEVDLAWVPPAETPDGPQWLPPCCSMDKAEGWRRATRAHSQNKLLQSVIVPVKTRGPSQVAIRIRHRGVETVEIVNLNVGPPRAPAAAYWPWLAFPALAIGVFCLRERLAKH